MTWKGRRKKAEQGDRRTEKEQSLLAANLFMVVDDLNPSNQAAVLIIISNMAIGWKRKMGMDSRWKMEAGRRQALFVFAFCRDMHGGMPVMAGMGGRAEQNLLWPSSRLAKAMRQGGATGGGISQWRDGQRREGGIRRHILYLSLEHIMRGKACHRLAAPV